MDCYPDAAERFGELRHRRAVPPGSSAGSTAGCSAGSTSSWASTAPWSSCSARSTPASDDRPRFEVIPNWERLDQFPDVPVEPWEGYESLPVDGRTVVLYLGNTGVGHGFGTVLDAAAQLADEALFLFVGGGARWADLEREVAASGLTNVVLRGYVPKDDTPAVMAGADLALITLDDRSLGVMSPSKLHANLAAGLPVVYVGPEGSNVDEAIRRHDVGRSLRHGDVKGLVAGRSASSPPTTAPARAPGGPSRSTTATRRRSPRFDRVLDGGR